MPDVDIPITDGFYVSDALPISAQRCINFYPNFPETDSVTQANLFNTPGLSEAIDLTNLRDICRGAHTLRDKPYVIIGQKLHRIDFDGTTFTSALIGTIEGTDRVIIDDNGDQLAIVSPDADKTYIYDVDSASLAEVTDVNFDGPASHVVYIDGFFVFAKKDGTKFFNSPLKDGRGLPGGVAYDALDFSQAEADPDDIAALGKSRSQLYVFGSETTQIFRNTGRSPAPFIGLSGGVVDVGCKSPQTIQRVSGGLIFVGSTFNETPSVWLLIGGNKTKISTPALDNELSKLTEDEVSDLFSWYYAESGHFFYGMSFPDTTYVYDLVTKKWHERQSVEKDGSSLTQYRVAAMTAAYNRVMVGDLQNGQVGFIDEDVYLDYGFLSRRIVTTKAFDNGGHPIFLDQVEAVVESGIGLTEDMTVRTGSTSLGIPITAKGGSDPQITMSWSDDGGRTFKGLLSRSMGKIGEYIRRPIWNRLGRFPRSRILRFEVASPTKVTLVKVEARING